MGRKPREQSKTGLYHIIARGNNKSRLFHDEPDFRKWLEITESFLRKHRLQLYHYCLMTNHVHQLIRSSEYPAISAFMHSTLRSYFHFYRRKYRFSGHLFQGRFKSLPIDDESYLLECGRYIERNPVRAKIVENPEDWPYSSYPVYALGRLDSLVSTSVAYEGLAETTDERQQLYRDYVRQPRIYESLIDKQLVQA